MSISIKGVNYDNWTRIIGHTVLDIRSLTQDSRKDFKRKLEILKYTKNILEHVQLSNRKRKKKE